MFAVRRASAVTARVATAVRPAAQVRAVGAIRFKTDNLDDRRSALENSYFNKEDERLMRGLLKKLKVQADDVDTHRAKGQRKAEKSHLLEIVGKYGMSQEDITALIEWKHEDH